MTSQITISEEELQQLCVEGATYDEAVELWLARLELPISYNEWVAVTSKIRRCFLAAISKGEKSKESGPKEVGNWSKHAALAWQAAMTAVFGDTWRSQLPKRPLPLDPSANA